MTFPPRGKAASRSGLDYGIIMLLLAALWMASRPYRGVIHDARLYMAQALYHIKPENFETDLFFRFGSQDSYSLFSLIFAPAVQHLGPGWAHLLFAIAGQVIWFAALVTLVIAMFGRTRAGLAAAIGAIVLVSNFGSGVFSYSEPFVTPRIFAEAMVMVALAGTLKGRAVLPPLLAGAAVLVHPLVALPGVLVVALLTVPINVWTVVAGVLAAALFAALAFAGVDPFARILVQFDPEWFGIVYDRIPLVFIRQWGWNGVTLITLPLTLLALSYPAWRSKRRQIFTVLLVAVSGVLVSWLVGDLLRNVLVLNVQLWRGLWLVTLLGNMFAAAAVLGLPKGSQARGYLIVALIVNLCESANSWIPFASAALAACAVVAHLTERRWDGKVPALLRLPPALAGVGAVLVLVTEIVFLLPWMTDTLQAVLVVLRLSGAYLAIYLLLNRQALHSLRPLSALLLCAVPVVLVLTSVDQQSDWLKYTLNNDAPDPEIVKIVDGRATYWEGRLDMLWYKMRKPSFHSCVQGAGIMFYRGTAMEYQHRSAVLSTLNTVDFRDNVFGLCFLKADPGASGPTSEAQLVSVCKNLPDLELMILAADSAEAPQRRWQPPVAIPAAGSDNRFGRTARADRAEPGVYHIYDCDELLPDR